MSTKAFLIVLAASIGGLIGVGAAIDYGWRITLAAAALLVLAGLAVRAALGRANRQHLQINQDEIDKPRRLARELDDDPDPFRMQYRPVLRDHDDAEEQP
jgi:UPF0716 family protein affecting phage T7 exclusion